MALSKLGSRLLVLAAAAIAAFGPMHAQADVFKFSLAGLEGGGIFFGEFSATDLNLDGHIVAGSIGSGEELDALTVNLSGNSILPDFSLKDPIGNVSFIYKLGTRWLGDDLVPSESYAEFLSFDDLTSGTIVRIVDFSSAFNVLGTPRFENNPGELLVLIGDTSTGNVLFEESIAVTGLIEVNRVPLPGSLVLVASGLAGLLGLSSRAKHSARRLGHSVR